MKYQSLASTPFAEYASKTLSVCDSAVNEVYLWLSMTDKQIGDVVIGGSVPTFRNLSSASIVLNHFQLFDKLDQAELYMRCPECEEYINDSLSQVKDVRNIPVDFCCCDAKKLQRRPCVLLFCRVALGRCLVVHGRNQLYMHQDKDGGETYFQVMGKIGILKESRSRNAQNESDRVKELLRNRGFQDTDFKEYELNLDTEFSSLDFSDVRYLFFFADCNSRIFRHVVGQRMPDLSTKSFYIHHCSSSKLSKY